MDRLLEEFLEEIQTPSVSGAEELFARQITVKLEGIGLAVERDKAGNLIARWPGDPGRQTLLFAAHLDTVPTPPVEHRLDGDWIRADGKSILSADDKAAISVILEVLRSMREEGEAHGPIEVLLTVGEEVGLMGAKAFDSGAVSAPFFLVLDHCGPPGTVVRSAPFAQNLSFRFTGRAAHSGIEPEKGISAIQVMARAVERMPLGRLDAETTANIGLVQGGTATNIVAEFVQMKGEARSLDPAKLDRQVTAMIQAAELSALEFGARLDMESSRDYQGYVFADDDPLLLLLGEAARAADLPFMLEDAGGASDANVFNAKGRPTIVLSCGFYGAHTFREKVSLTQMRQLADYLRAIIRRV